MVIVLLLGGLLWWRPWVSKPTSTVAVVKSETPSCGAMASSSVPAVVEIPLASAWPDVAIKVGQTVEWRNNTQIVQHLQSETAEGQACGGFGTKGLAPGAEVRLTLLHSGDWSFVASNGFGGVITVE